MRVGYTRRRNPLSRESGVISKSFLFEYWKLDFFIKTIYIVFYFKKEKTRFSFAATQQQQVSALRIPNNFFFLSAKDCYHLVWEPRLCRYGSEKIFWIYGCWYDYCINAYDCQASQNWTSKCRGRWECSCFEKQRTGSFFFSFLRKEKPADLDLALMASSIKWCFVVAKQQKKAYEQHL